MLSSISVKEIADRGDAPANARGRNTPAPAAVRHQATRSARPRIAINGRFLTQAVVGVQRFASETVKAMDRCLSQPEYAGLRGQIEIIAPSAAREIDLACIPVRRHGWLKGHFWEQLEFPFWGAGGLLVNLCLVGPVATRHQIIVAHDATVRAMPGNFSWKFRLAYDFLVPRLLRSDLVMTVSDFSRREIGKYYGVDIDRIPICYEGADHITTIPADRSVLDRTGIVGKPYLLGVGVDSRNKNMEVVIDAFARAGLKDTLLVLTGRRDPRVHAYSINPSDSRVRLTGYVSDAELRALYENALALVYPSRYEGFGLPPIEAMQCGCPVIVSDQPALVEIGADAVLTCGMDDIKGLSRLLKMIQSDAALRARLTSAGRERAGLFTWERTARSLLDHCGALIAPM